MMMRERTTSVDLRVALLGLLLAMTLAGSAMSASTILRSHVNSYASMTPAQFLSSAVSQRFTDLNNRSVLTAVSLDILPSTQVSVQALMFEFVLGRRAIGSRSAFNFAWDALRQLPAPLVVDVFIYSNCADAAHNCTSCPCTLLRAIRMDSISNSSAFYLHAVSPFGNIYHCDVLLHNRVGDFVIAAPSATKNERVWFVYVAHLPSVDGPTAYEYTHRLPVSSGPTSQPALMVQDVDHILGGNWTSWMDGNSLSTAYFSNITNPLTAFMIAGAVSAYNGTPPSPPPSPPSPLPPPTLAQPPAPAPAPTPSPTAPSPSPSPPPPPPVIPTTPTDAETPVPSSSGEEPPLHSPTPAVEELQPLSAGMIAVFATAASVAFIILVCAIILAIVGIVRVRRRWREKRNARESDSSGIPFSTLDLNLDEADREVPTSLEDGPLSGRGGNAWVSSDQDQPNALVLFGTSVLAKASLLIASLSSNNPSNASSYGQIGLHQHHPGGMEAISLEDGTDDDGDFDSFGEPSNKPRVDVVSITQTGGTPLMLPRKDPAKND